MKGRIKMYNSQDKFGFVLGDDGKDYFFDVSSIISNDIPIQGMIVEFDHENGEKGIVGKNILIKKQNDAPAFVILGNERIKLSNIKDYGISKETKYYEKVYEKEVETVPINSKLLNFVGVKSKTNVIWKYKGKITEIKEERYNSVILKRTFLVKAFLNKGEEYQTSITEDSFELRLRTATKDNIYEVYIDKIKPDVFYKDVDYLYVTTYQNNNYKFFQNDLTWNIKEKCAELDGYLCL